MESDIQLRYNSQTSITINSNCSKWLLKAMPSTSAWNITRCWGSIICWRWHITWTWEILFLSRNFNPTVECHHYHPSHFKFITKKIMSMHMVRLLGFWNIISRSGFLLNMRSNHDISIIIGMEWETWMDASCINIW